MPRGITHTMVPSILSRACEAGRIALLIGALTVTSKCLFGTTIIYIVTPDGIVLAADSEVVEAIAKVAANERATKLTVVRHQFAVATAWATWVHVTMMDPRTGQTYILKYSFEPWIRSIETHLPPHVTVTRLSEIIEQESATTFRDFGVLLKSGLLKYDKSRGNTFVRYYIAGYENRLPMLYQVQLEGDWNAGRLVGPERSLIYPKQGFDPNFCLRVAGVHFAIDDILTRRGEPYHEALARMPKEISKLLGRQNLSLQEAVDVAVCLIRIEAKYNPGTVSPPVRVSTITPNGVASLAVYP